MPAVFITGTDTDVGKTVVCAALASAALALGQQVCVYKPAQSGPDRDLLKIQDLVGKPVTTCCDYSFTIPAAPYVSDDLENGDSLVLSPNHILARIKTLAADNECLLVEGAGGVRVPLATGFEVIDLIEQSGLPALVVARPNLGTINHTLLTVSALQDRQIPVVGVVVSGMPTEAELSLLPDAEAIRALPGVFQTFLPVPVLAYLPRFSDLSQTPGVFGTPTPVIQALYQAIST